MFITPTRLFVFTVLVASPFLLTAAAESPREIDKLLVTAVTTGQSEPVVRFLLDQKADVWVSRTGQRSPLLAEKTLIELAITKARNSESRGQAFMSEVNIATLLIDEADKKHPAFSSIYGDLLAGYHNYGPRACERVFRAMQKYQEPTLGHKQPVIVYPPISYGLPYPR